ncbi:MAG: DeoR/GlpR family DNA-binding transcription regulator [Herbinix sp.]|nr:DeoR/GlpR family DNA-binding transcription regulator [Herbinix sp.]
MVDRNAILAFINTRKNVTIYDLCESFNISESTARRTISYLEEKGKIGRYHGGAFSLLQNPKTQIISRLDENTDKKIRIAQSASEIVCDNSTIILLGGTTVSYMCTFIKKKRITVITNSMLVLDELKNCPNIKLIILGGLYNNDESEVGGILSNSSLSYLRADLLFMGASGFDEKSGFINANHSVELFRTCVKASNETNVLVDSSKYNSGGSSIAASPEQIKRLYTNSDLDPRIIKSFQLKGVEVILS